jgi:hypothetical protein
VPEERKNMTKTDVVIKYVSDDSVLVDDGDSEVWLSIEKITNWDADWDPGDRVSIEIPDWYAETTGLV